MDIKEKFDQAVADSGTLSEKPGNDVLLKLYSLYKQATAGDAPQQGTYGMFDFAGKAKHDAWLKLQGLAKEQAMQQYIDTISLLKNQAM